MSRSNSHSVHSHLRVAFNYALIIVGLGVDFNTAEFLSVIQFYIYEMAAVAGAWLGDVYIMMSSPCTFGMPLILWGVNGIVCHQGGKRLSQHRYLRTVVVRSLVVGCVSVALQSSAAAVLLSLAHEAPQFPYAFDLFHLNLLGVRVAYAPVQALTLALLHMNFARGDRSVVLNLVKALFLTILIGIFYACPAFIGLDMITWTSEIPLIWHGHPMIFVTSQTYRPRLIEYIIITGVICALQCAMLCVRMASPFLSRGTPFPTKPSNSTT